MPHKSFFYGVFACCGLLALLTPQAQGSDNRRVTPAAPTVKLLSPAREQQLRQMLPKVDDRMIQRILDDPRLILYTEQEMPPAYQDWNGALQGVHSVNYNISANNSEPFGNGNLEFPWGTPAGTHRCTNVHTFKFLWLPPTEQGRVWPVVWYRSYLPGDSAPAFRWVFPIGAVLGEVLTMRGPDGYEYTFEMRVRVREKADWAVDVFRPFPTAESLATRIRALRPQWHDDPTLAQLVQHLESPIQLVSHTLADQQPVTVFRESMGIDRLPPAGNDRLISELLTTTTFQSALGRVWRKGTNKVWAFAPTTEAPFHIVPAHYDAGFIEVDRESCLRCHNTVGLHVNEFNSARDWYGRIRGSDGIFSFHPFEPVTVSGNGYGQNVQMRGAFVSGGVLERFDPNRHPTSVYQQAEGVAP